MSFPKVRMRRLRRTTALRQLLRNVKVHPSNLVYPVFLDEKAEAPVPVNSMPGVYRLPLGKVVDEVQELTDRGVCAVLLFGVPATKDEEGSSAYAADGVVQEATRMLKEAFGGGLVVITDVCLCEYTSHGHCGIVEKNEVSNDVTLRVLQKIAVSHAEAGADVVAPSAMMDGQVSAVRQALDEHGYSDVAIMAYSAKYASSFYGPFREAAGSTPMFGDRQGYQMDYARAYEALREMALDIDEGADIIMVKPALAYLDIIHAASQRFQVPIAAYSVSAEYAMVKAAAQNGWLNESAVVNELLTAIKRAGADLIITYFAKDVNTWMRSK